MHINETLGMQLVRIKDSVEGRLLCNTHIAADINVAELTWMECATNIKPLCVAGRETGCFYMDLS